jgi:hypothetical protein
MSEPVDPDPSRAEEAPRETACLIAEQIAPLVRQAHVKEFAFLAYLLGMSLKKSRRLREWQHRS